MLRQPVRATLLGVLLLGPSLAYADYRRGQEAFDQGNFGIAAAEFRTSAQEGDPLSMNFLGMMQFSGVGLARDPVSAVQMFSKAASRGNPAATFNLGLCYAYGMGVGRNPVVAAKHFRTAADAGIARGQYAYGLARLNGNGVAADLKEGFVWIRKAADQALPGAQCFMGRASFRGVPALGLEPDPAAGLAWIRKAADQSDSLGLYELGVCYKDGQGVPADPAEAGRCFERSALLESVGSADAQADLGWLYLAGAGVPRDVVRGRCLVELAAGNQSGHGKALLGDLVRREAATPEAAARSLELYREAANLGDPFGAFRLGCLLLAGQGPATPDAATALRWLRMAANEDCPGARFLLGAALLAGLGPRPDPGQGAALLHQSRLCPGPLQASEAEARTWFDQHPAGDAAPSAQGRPASFEEVKDQMVLRATADRAVRRLHDDPWGDFIQEQP